LYYQPTNLLVIFAILQIDSSNTLDKDPTSKSIHSIPCSAFDDFFVGLYPNAADDTS